MRNRANNRLSSMDLVGLEIVWKLTRFWSKGRYAIRKYVRREVETTTNLDLEYFERRVLSYDMSWCRIGSSVIGPMKAEMDWFLARSALAVLLCVAKN